MVTKEIYRIYECPRCEHFERAVSALNPIFRGWCKAEKKHKEILESGYDLSHLAPRCEKFILGGRK
jgi:hypothetical protein